MLLQMLLQVYHGQDDDINTLPYLVGCAFIYFWYRFFTSSKSDSNSTRVKEKVADSETSTEILASLTGEARTIDNRPNSIEEMDARDYLAQAFDLVDINEFRESIELIDKAISLDVQSLNPHLYNARGKILLTTMKYIGALKDFERAIKLISARVGENDKYLTEFTKNRTEAQERIQAVADSTARVLAAKHVKYAVIKQEDEAAESDKVKRMAAATAKVADMFPPKKLAIEQKRQSESNPSTNALDESDEAKMHAQAFAAASAKAASIFALAKPKQVEAAVETELAIEQKRQSESNPSTNALDESDEAKMKAEATAALTSEVSEADKAAMLAKAVANATVKVAAMFGNKAKQIEAEPTIEQKEQSEFDYSTDIL